MIDRDPFPPVTAHDAPPMVQAARAAFAPPYDLVEDPHAGIGFLRMALWLLILIPLSEAWTAFRQWRKN